VVGPSLIDAVPPRNASGAKRPSSVRVTISNHGDASWAAPGHPNADVYTFEPGVPYVSGVAPNEGPITGGTRVVVSGSGFKINGNSAISEVSFQPLIGGHPVEAASFTVMSDSKLVALTPHRPADALHGAVSLDTDVILTGPGSSSPDTSAGRFTFNPLSIVQLGDSVASGEGTLYGFSYDAKREVWVGPSNPDPTWEGHYGLCHDSKYAYGNVVSEALHAKFTQLACTGASFAHGIVAPDKNPNNNQVRGPAQFGDWASQALNAEYTAAKPDVVLITLGADDVRFAAIVKDCLQSRLLRLHRRCTEANPGPVVEDYFTDTLPRLQDHLRTLTQWIQERGRAADPPKVPKIVFDTYYEPFPARACADTWLLTQDQVSFLAGLLPRLNAAIAAGVDQVRSKDVTVVHLSGAFAGHTWCTADPWAYGLSILRVLQKHPENLLNVNPAPFHPDPQGQREITSLVTPVVELMVGAVTGSQQSQPLSSSK
jgi:lysophospholipase L1-like esterase